MWEFCDSRRAKTNHLSSFGIVLTPGPSSPLLNIGVKLFHVLDHMCEPTRILNDTVRQGTAKQQTGGMNLHRQSYLF